jgi:hypothetical protein
LPLQRQSCEECGAQLGGHQEKYCSDRCRWKAWDKANPRQRQLPLDPAPAPLPPVQDPQVPKAERPRLQRMARLIVERVEQGPARASELHAMFPGARSVRTRISDAGRFVSQPGSGRKWCSRPLKNYVGDWEYWIEAL